MIGRYGFWLGAAAFVLMLLVGPPGSLQPSAWKTAAVLALMATWWLTEAVPVVITGALPFLLLPLLGVAKADVVASKYMTPVLFLVLGGAMLGIVLERWGLTRRLAVAVVSRTSPEPARLMLAVMIATACVALIVNVSATTLMMLPIATATLKAVAPDIDSGSAGVDARRFGSAMIFGVAIASNIGSLATPLGTPVNPVVMGIIEQRLGIQITFVQWASFGLPLAIVALPIGWWVLSRVALRFRLPAGRREDLLAALGTVGPMTVAEKRVLGVIFLASVAWICLPYLDDHLPGLTDAGIAVAAALLLCIVPSGLRGRAAAAEDDPAPEPDSGRYLLEWREARRAPWHLVLLLGGGIALADSVVKSGLSTWLADALQGTAALPTLSLLVVICAICILVTEGASNLATASIFVPIAAAIATAGGHDPLLAALVAGVAASWGFANPAGMSSNAMALGTGRISVRQMLAAGFLVDLVGVLLVSVVLWIVVPLLR